MTGLERAWARELLSAFASSSDGGLTTHAGEVDYQVMLNTMLRESNPMARTGLRLGIWLAAFAPLWRQRRWATVCQLDEAERRELLGEMLLDRGFLARETVALLKLAASLALFDTQSVRERSGCDVVGGPRKRRPSGPRLPLAGAPANQVTDTDDEHEAA